MTTTRPTVTVIPVANEHGDLTHCTIQVGDVQYQATFTEDHVSLNDRILDEAGVKLTTEETMTVTRASRQQMEREAARIKPLLEAMPAGTVACLADGLFFWLDAAGDLVWDEWMTINGESPANSRYIEDIGEIDTEELFQVAEHIRTWCAAPAYQQADVDWLHGE